MAEISSKNIDFLIKKTEIQEIVSISFDCWKYYGLFRSLIRLFIGEIPNSNHNYLNWAEMVQRNSDKKLHKCAFYQDFLQLGYLYYNISNRQKNFPSLIILIYIT